MRLPCRHARRTLRGGQSAAGTGIEYAVRAVRRGAGGLDLRLDVPARAEAGIEQAGGVEAIERRGVRVEMRRLAPHRTVPLEAQPSQILQASVGDLRPAAAGVDVLDAQQDAAAGGPRRRPG